MPHQDELTYFCENVAYLRKTHNLSKKDMAGIMDIGIKRLNRSEQLDFLDSLDVTALVYLSDYFKIPIPSLFHPLPPLTTGG